MKMKKGMKRLISLFLCMAMLLAMAPATTFAGEGAPEVAAQTTEAVEPAPEAEPVPDMETTTAAPADEAGEVEAPISADEAGKTEAPADEAGKVEAPVPADEAGKTEAPADETEKAKAPASVDKAAAPANVPADGDDADQEEVQNEGLTIRLNAADVQNVPGSMAGMDEVGEVPAVQSGDTVWFEVESALSDSLLREDVAVKLTFVSNGIALNFDRFADDGDGNLIYDMENGSGEAVRFTLTGDKDTGYEISYTLKQGQTVNALLSYRAEKGTTPNGSSVTIGIKTDDVPQDLKTDLEINGQTGDYTIYNLAEVSWSQVKKTADVKSVLLANGEIEKNIVYSFASRSLGGDTNTLYAQVQKLTDTLTLPEGFSLLKGDGEVTFQNGQAVYTVNGTSVLTFAPQNYEANADNTSITVTEAGFTYVRETEDPQQEMEPLDLKVTLHKEGVKVTAEAAKNLGEDGVIVRNSAELTVSPDRENPDKGSQTTQSGPVDVKVLPAKYELTAKKTASIQMIAMSETEEVIFQYIIKITNSGNAAAKGVKVEDIMPEGIAFTAEAITAKDTEGAAVGTVQKETGSFNWTGDVAVGETVTITVPVRVDKDSETAKNWAKLAAGKTDTVKNTANVTPPEGDTLTPECELPVTGPDGLKPIAADKTPVLLRTRVYGSENTLLVYDLTRQNRYVDVSDETVAWYMVQLYNRNDTAQTYHLTDPQDTGYYKSDYFQYTRVPNPMMKLDGKILVQPADSNGYNDGNPYGAHTPIIDENNQITGVDTSTSRSNWNPTKEVGDGDLYYFVGADGESKDVDAEVTVNANSYTYVFLPFKLSPSIYSKLGGSESSPSIKYIPENTITIENTDLEIPEEPQEFQSEQMPVLWEKTDIQVSKKAMDPSKNLYSELPKGTWIGVPEKGKEEYVYYRIAINNAASGNNMYSASYRILDVLPPYLKVDGASYCTEEDGPSKIKGDASFFETYCSSGGMTVASNAAPVHTEILEEDAPPYYIQYMNYPGAVNATIYTYQTKATQTGYTEDSLKTPRDAVYVEFDHLPNSDMFLYIRCKVDVEVEEFLENDPKIVYDNDHGYDYKETMVNVVFGPSSDEPIMINDDIILILRGINPDKHIIAPEHYEEVRESMNAEGGITLDMIKQWEEDQWLIDRDMAFPGQEVHYLLSYPVGYAEMQTLKMTGHAEPENWSFRDVLPRLEPFILWKQNTGGELKEGEFRVENAPNNPPIGKITYVTNYFDISDITAEADNPLALQIVSLKFPANTEQGEYLNENNYLFRGGSVGDLYTSGKDTVSHVLATVDKKVTRDYVNKTIPETTYELTAPRIASVRLKKLSMSDDLTKTREYFDITGVDFGVFWAIDLMGENVDGHLLLTTEDGSSHTVSMKTVEAGMQTSVTADDGTVIPVSEIVKIDWNFWEAGKEDGGISYLMPNQLSGSSKRTMEIQVRLKSDLEITENIKVPNTTLLSYTTEAGDEVKLTDGVEVNILSNPELKKQMKIGGVEVTADRQENLLEGTEAEFAISYTNNSSERVDLSELEFHDVLGEGLVQNCTVTAKTSVGTLSNSGKITFVNGEATIWYYNGYLQPGNTVTITYKAPVSGNGGDINNTVTAGNMTAKTPTITSEKKAVLDALVQKGVTAVGGNEAERRVYDMNGADDTITYNAVVYNSGDSNMELPVSFLYDVLPENFSFVSMAGGQAKETYSEPSGWTNSKARAYTGPYTVAGEGTDGTVSFRVTPAGESGPVQLAPGEYLTFAYKCRIDQEARYEAYKEKEDGEDFPSTNTLYLAVDVADEDAEALALSTTGERFANPGTVKNDGDCGIVEAKDVAPLDKAYGTAAEGWLESPVTVTSAVLPNPDVDKEAVLHRSKDGESAEVPEEFITYNGQKLFEADAAPAVRWEVSIDNREGKKAIQDYTVTDILPEDYVMAGDSGLPLARMTELDADGNIRKYGTAQYTYGDIVFSLYNKAGICVFSKAVQRDGDTIDLSGTDYRVLAGQRAVLSYWTCFTKEAAVEGVFTNKATVQFSEKLDPTKEYGPDAEVTPDSVTISESVRTLIGYASSSVKQIILDGKYVNIKKGTGEYQARYIQGDYTAGGDDTGNGYGDKHANGYGNRQDNYVVAKTNGDKVGYTLNIRNDSFVDMKELVVIDKLPYKGDNGTNNQDSNRGSQFEVKFDTDSDMVVEITDTLNGNVVKKLDASRYTLEFSEKTGYTSKDWNGAASSAWHETYGEKDRSFRLLLKDGFALEPGQYVRVYFKGIVGEDAVPGQIAWNSFGYRYRPEGKSEFILAAEPARVGVMVSQVYSAQLALKKTDEGQNPMEGVKFCVYSSEDCKKEELVSVMETGPDGIALSAPIPIEAVDVDAPVKDENIFYVKEETPEGYAENKQVYKVQLLKENTVYDVATGKELCASDAADTGASSATAIVNTANKVIIQKTDKSQNALKGATLELTLTGAAFTENALTVSGTDTCTVADGKLVFVTNGEDIMISRLPAGNYILKETDAPEGYKIAKPISFTVQKDGTVRNEKGEVLTDMTVRMIDDKNSPEKSEPKKKKSKKSSSEPPAPAASPVVPVQTTSTGDESNILMWFALLGMAVLGLAAVWAERRRYGR